MAEIARQLAFCAVLLYQNNPTIFPSSFTSIAFAEGTFGRPGIVIRNQIEELNGVRHSWHSVKPLTPGKQVG